MCGKVNNVLCYFNKCDPLVRLKLIRSYCSDLYGSVLLDMPHSSIDYVCIAWRKGLRRALGLPWRTHSALLALVTGTLPLMDELLCRTAMFVSKCLTSDNFVACHSVYGLRQNSPVGRNALWCCTKFGLRLDIHTYKQIYIAPKSYNESETLAQGD